MKTLPGWLIGGLASIITASTASACGRWIEYTVPELVQANEFIVVATLSDVRRECDGICDYSTGTLTVKETLWGDATPGRRLLFSWTTDLWHCGGLDFRGDAGSERIWFLKRDAGRMMTAFHPQQSIPVSERPAVIQALREHPVCLQTPAYCPSDAYDRVRLIVRNPGSAPITVPLAAETTAAAARTDPDAQFLSISYSGGSATTSPLLLLTSAPDATTVILPGREYRCEMRADSLGFPTDTGPFRWVLHGVGTSNEAWLYNSIRGNGEDVTGIERPPLWFRLMSLWTVNSR